MKLLKKLLLIHWHYIDNELLEFENVNFLTGKNASGKSTIIDALQLLMLGDTSGHFFNKAASDRSRRTLKGYLRCEVGDDGETGSRYLRSGDFTSYIVAEFCDPEKRKPLTIGAVFDSYSDDKHEHRFFILPKDPIPDHRFIKEGTPMPIRELQAWLKQDGSVRHEFFETNRRFRESLLGQMGGLKEKYFKLFQRAVPFTPTIDIEDFISEFVCDVVNEVNIQDMQQNIRIYREMEHQAEAVKENITLLKGIQDKFTLWQREQDRLRQQQYLLDRAHLESIVCQLRELEEETARLSSQLTQLRVKRERLDPTIDEKRQRQRELERDIDRSDIKQVQERLETELKQLEKELADLTRKKQQLATDISGYIQSARTLAQAAPSLVPELKAEAAAVKATCSELSNLVDKEEYSQALEQVPELSTLAEALAAGLADRCRKIQAELAEKQEERDRLRHEVAQLKKGIKPFDPRLLTLQQLIQEHVEKSQPRIFCDLLEVTEPKWQDAIEGYLHRQKFYLLIRPEAFVPALRIYDQHKGEHNLHSFGLVDIEKLMAKDNSPRPDSLAAKVVTEDPHARALADYLLGRVVCCDAVEDLRSYEIAITPGCMLYQGHVARQLDPARYRDPYIGKESIRRQIESKEKAIAILKSEIKELEELYKQFCALPRYSPLSDSMLERLKEDARDVRNIPALAAQREKTEAELSQLDLTWLNQQEKKLAAIKDEIKKLEMDRESIVNRQGRIQEKLEHNKSLKPVLERQQGAAREELAEKYPEDWTRETGEPRFAQELERLKTPAEITSRFSSQVARTRSQAAGHFAELRSLREDYNRKNHLSLRTEAEDNQDFDRMLGQLEETYMEKYVPKIKEAQNMAERQFKEDFISKLRSNIETAQQQLEEINKVLKNIPFGQERYRFRVQPRKGKRKFYDMIMDDLLLEGNDLFAGPFQQKHKEAIDDLFTAIVRADDILSDADARTELEKNLEEFTDYRKYLEFDLLSIDDEGRETRLSKMLNKRSGGETQNPFYIAVLASFVHVYRVRQQGYSNTLRLIVFDEAFNKMDHQRIQESIKLAKRLGLQMLISAPTEKVADIAPLVDRNLCVTRVRSQCVVRAFDPKEVLEE